jgi:hypothetical protein
VTRIERAFVCCEVHDLQGNIHQAIWGSIYSINEMYGVKEMELLWWERQGQTNKGKRARRTFEETKKVASRSDEGAMNGTNENQHIYTHNNISTVHK